MLDVTIDGDEVEAEVVTVSCRVPDGMLVITLTGSRISKVLIDHTGTQASKDVVTWEEEAENLWFAD